MTAKTQAKRPHDESQIIRPKRQYFIPMPHIADDDLDPYQYRLLGHYMRVAGDGQCNESTETTARRVRFSKRKVTDVRKQLTAMGYIHCEYTTTADGDINGPVIVTIADVEEENVRWCKHYRCKWELVEGMHHMQGGDAPHAGGVLHHMQGGDAPHATEEDSLEEDSLEEEIGEPVGSPTPVPADPPKTRPLNDHQKRVGILAGELAKDKGLAWESLPKDSQTGFIGQATELWSRELAPIHRERAITPDELTTYCASRLDDRKKRLNFPTTKGKLAGSFGAWRGLQNQAVTTPAPKKAVRWEWQTDENGMTVNYPVYDELEVTGGQAAD